MFGHTANRAKNFYPNDTSSYQLLNTPYSLLENNIDCKMLNDFSYKVVGEHTIFAVHSPFNIKYSSNTIEHDIY